MSPTAERDGLLVFVANRTKSFDRYWLPCVPAEVPAMINRLCREFAGRTFFVTNRWWQDDEWLPGDKCPEPESPEIGIAPGEK